MSFRWALLDVIFSDKPKPPHGGLTGDDRPALMMAGQKGKYMKEYTVLCHRMRRGEIRTSRFTGTLERLSTEVFGYTLECGQSWEHERGNSKINIHPKTAKSLVTNLNRAVANSAANGCPSEWYELEN